jgi:hypothetical protein
VILYSGPSLDYLNGQFDLLETAERLLRDIEGYPLIHEYSTTIKHSLMFIYKLAHLDNHSGFARLFPYRLSQKSTIYSLVFLIGEVGILEYELSKKTFCTGANSTPDRTRLPIGLQGVQVSLLARAQFHTVFRNVSTLRERKFYLRERRLPILL